MSWGAPDWLWCLLAIPLLMGLALWSAKRRQRATELFGNAQTVSPLIAGKAYWWRLVRAVLIALSLIMGVGLSWSIIRRRLSGQLDVDDVEE